MGIRVKRRRRRRRAIGPLFRVQLCGGVRVRVWTDGRGGRVPEARARRALVVRLVRPVGMRRGLGERVVGEPLRVPLDVPRRSVPSRRSARGPRGALVLVVVSEIPGEPVMPDAEARPRELRAANRRRRRAHRLLGAPAIGALLRDHLRRSLRDGVRDVRHQTAAEGEGAGVGAAAAAAAAARSNLLAAAAPLPPGGRRHPDRHPASSLGDLIRLPSLAVPLLAFAVPAPRGVLVPRARSLDVRRVPGAAASLSMRDGGAGDARVAREHGRRM